MSNISAIFMVDDLWWRKPPTYRKSLTNFITQCCIALAGLELTTLVVIGTDCIGNCQSNYHKITTAMVPVYL